MGVTLTETGDQAKKIVTLREFAEGITTGLSSPAKAHLFAIVFGLRLDDISRSMKIAQSTDEKEVLRNHLNSQTRGFIGALNTIPNFSQITSVLLAGDEAGDKKFLLDKEKGWQKFNNKVVDGVVISGQQLQQFIDSSDNTDLGQIFYRPDFDFTMYRMYRDMLLAYDPVIAHS